MSRGRAVRESSGRPIGELAADPDNAREIGEAAARGLECRACGRILDMEGFARHSVYKDKLYRKRIEPRFVDVIVQRWAAFAGQQPTLEDGTAWTEVRVARATLDAAVRKP